MKRILLVVIILVALATIFFIPFERTGTVTIKSPFFKVYKQLLIARNWANWFPDIKKDFDTDSARVLFVNKPEGYGISTPNTSLNVHETASNFIIEQQGITGDHAFSYTAIPGANTSNTLISVTLKTNFAGYVAALFSREPLKDTRINDFKRYLENDDLFYGYPIYKTRVPSPDLIVIRKQVAKNLAFAAADSSFNELKNFALINQANQVAPVIAQFIPKNTDTLLVNVGIYIDKPVNPTGHILYSKMIKNGPLVAADFKGRFADRLKAHQALNRYFNDHAMEIPVLPFESYLDNRLPLSDRDIVNIRVNFTTFSN